MKGQISLEFLVITAGMLAIYAVVFPLLFSSFQTSLLGFNTLAANSIAQQIKWKAEEVALLEQGALLTSRFSSPVEFVVIVNNGELFTDFNYSDEINALDNELFLAKGRNEFVFEKTEHGVEIYSK